MPLSKNLKPLSIPKQNLTLALTLILGLPSLGLASAPHPPRDFTPNSAQIAWQEKTAAELKPNSDKLPRQEPPSSQENSLATLLKEDLAKQEFEEALKLVLPLKPEEVRQAKKKQEALERAQHPNPAHLQIETRTIPLTPNSVPEVVRLTQGYSSTLIFHDATGRPWPILHLVLGNPEAFSVVQAKNPSQHVFSEASPRATQISSETKQEQKAERSEQNPHSHIINVVPLKDLASSNLVVSLEDAPYPVILHLIADSPLASTRTTDALLTFRLQGQGPLAKVNLEAGELKTEYHNELLGFIHGLPNPEAKALGLDPPEPLTKLWSLKDKLYLRTQADLIHPAWLAVAQGEDLNVYVLPKTRALVLAKDGQSRTLRIVGPKPKEQ